MRGERPRTPETMTNLSGQSHVAVLDGPKGD